MAFSGFVAVRLAFPKDGPIDFEVNVYYILFIIIIIMYCQDL